METCALRPRSIRAALALGALAYSLALGACRDASGSASTGVVKIKPSGAGAHGCSGPDQAFTPPQVPAAVALAVLAVDPWSHVVASATSETLYATGAGATVVAIDVSGASPVETALVSAGTVAALLAGSGIATPPRLSAIGVLDAGTLLVQEHTSNTILSVALAVPDTVAFWAGEPSEVPGFADGFALGASGPPVARFSFTSPGQICPTGHPDGRVYLADPGNHAVRQVLSGFVSTVCGQGGAFFQDGDLAEAGFDTPAGLAVACSGRLIAVERGVEAAGGHRLRQILVGKPSLFGTTGSVTTLAGDGTAATLQGNGPLAQLFAPTGVLSTSEDDTYWVDSGSGILRRMRGAQDAVDCPLWSDCAAAVAGGGDFAPGGVHSLTQTPAGVLYVLDGSAGALLRVTP